MESSSSSISKRTGSNAALPEHSPKKAKSKQDEEYQEKYFFKLLTMVLNGIIALKNLQEEDIGDAITLLITAFRENYFGQVDLTKWCNSCAYLFRYGSHGAALTQRKALEALESCDDFASRLKKSDNLNIISLGGGPGNDIIGLCSALYANQVRSRLNITVVDAVREWSSYVKLLKVFIEEGNFGNVSHLFQENNVKLSFIQNKLPGESDKNTAYFQCLRQADVILTTKLVSNLDWDEKKAVVQSIYENMKQEAFLLFIDSPFKEDLWSDFEIIYLSPDEPENKFYSTATTERFGSNNEVGSKARVAVLRKI